MAFRGKVEERAAQANIAKKLVALVRLSDLQVAGDASGDTRPTDASAIEIGIDAIVAEIYTVMCDADEQAFGFIMEIVNKLKSERLYAADIASR